MSYVSFNEVDSEWYWAPEYDYRIGESGFTADQINAVANTFYTMPVKLPVGSKPFIRKKRQWRTAQYLQMFETDDFENYEPIEITFSGLALNFTWMGYLADQIVNTGAGAPFTHTCDSSSSSGKSNPPRTIRLLHIIPNDKSTDERIVRLYTGVNVKRMEMSAETNGLVECSWTVEPANMVAGNVPTTIPTAETFEPYPFAYSDILTYSKGATTYNMVFKSFNAIYERDKTHNKGGTSYYGVDSCAANKATCEIDLEFRVMDKAIMDDVDEDTAGTLDKTVTIKIARTATDYFSYNITKAFVKHENDEWVDGKGHLRVKAKPNPKETGYKVILTEVNAIAATRY